MEDKARTHRSEELGMKNVTNLGIVSLFTDVSTEMILGILPYFVTVELGATKALLGLMEGASDFLNYISRVFSGVISDRIGRRKPLVFLGYASSNFAKPLFALTTTFGGAFAVRVADRIGKGVRTSPRDALISESVREALGGRAFGLHRSIDQLGAIVGPALAFLLLPLLGARGLFLISFAPGLVALTVLAFFVKDRKGSVASSNLLANAGSVLTRRFRLFLIVMGIFALGAYNFSFVLVKAGSLGVEERLLPLVYATLNVATVVTALPSGLLADRFGRDKMLGVSFGVFFLASLAAVVSTQGALLAFPIAFIYGSYLGMSETLQRAMVPSFVSDKLKGTGYAVYYLVVGACSLVANIVFGALWDQFSMSAAFTYSMILSVIAIAGMIGLILVKTRR